MSELVLPQSLDWHRQSANWLVGTSTAGLAWLGSSFPSTQVQEMSVMIPYYLSLLILGITMISGVVFYQALTSFGNAYEEEQATREELKQLERNPPNDELRLTERREGLRAELKQWDKNARARERVYKYAYRTLVLAFPLSIICSLAFLISKGAGEAQRKNGPTYFLFQPVAGSSSISVFRVDPSSNSVEILVNDTVTHSLSWKMTNATSAAVSIEN